MLLVNIGTKILQLRKEKDWSQGELGKQIGISQRFVSEWETGKSIPSASSLIKLSKIFAVSIDYLLLENVPKEGISGIDDFELYEYFRKTEALPKEKKELIKEVVDSIVFKEKVQEIPEAKLSKRPEATVLRKVAGKR